MRTETVWLNPVCAVSIHFRPEGRKMLDELFKTIDHLRVSIHFRPEGRKMHFQQVVLMARLNVSIHFRPEGRKMHAIAIHDDVPDSLFQSTSDPKVGRCHRITWRLTSINRFQSTSDPKVGRCSIAATPSYLCCFWTTSANIFF